jgi:leucyl/phenylalanyl-tRNA--protein transferase
LLTVPTEPPPTSWQFTDPEIVPDDLVGLGADLEPGTLLAAYRRGLFPMPLGEGDPMGWFSPEMRGVLPLDGMHVSRSLRRACRRFEIRVDTAFLDVVDGCADPSRTGAWIDDDIRTAYAHLHDLGWAHSVEAWRGGVLAGGLYGVAIGGLFAAESKFHRVRDASKVALVGLVDLLSDEYADQRLVDVQWQTDHLATLGVVEIPRSVYLDRLRTARQLPLPSAFS